MIAVVFLCTHGALFKVFFRKGEIIYSRTIDNSIQKPTVNHMALYLQETQR